MKILVINSLYKPDRRGGAELVVERIVRGLQKSGHQVSMICCGRQDVKENIDGVEIYRLSPRNIFNFLDINSQPFWIRAIWHVLDQFNYANAAKVSEILESVKPDLILSHNLKGIGYQVCGVLKNKEWIHTLHDVQLAVPSGLIIKGREKSLLVRNPYNWLYALINRRIFAAVTKVISPSQWLLDYYYNLGFLKNISASVIPNPIDGDMSFVNKNFNAVYAFAGQIEEHKGIRLLLRAFDKFSAQHPQAKLLVAGEGRLLNELKAQYSGNDRITFLGFVDYSSLAEKVFSKSSYLSVPSLCYENSPGAIYDSYLHSTPVLAARIGGIAELVEDGVNGFVFRADDEENLLATLNLTIEESGRYQSLSLAAYESVKQYSLEKYFERLFSLVKTHK